jgi:hypothetical protein
MAQALHIANGDTLNQKIEAKDNRVDQLLASGRSDTALVDEIYTLALSRPPTTAERDGIVKALAEGSSPAAKRPIVEDVFWSVMSSREFLFNH